MSTKDEEDAWRSIVENYGERARLDDDPEDAPAPEHDALHGMPGTAPDAEPSDPAALGAEPAGADLPRADLPRADLPDGDAVDADDPRTGTSASPAYSGGTFIPFEGLSGYDQDPDPVEAPDARGEARFVPETPPLPYVEPRRLTAWAVLVLAPIALILCGAMDVHVHPLLRAALVAGPLGAFGYLFATMSREPRDPFDDGARV